MPTIITTTTLTESGELSLLPMATDDSASITRVVDVPEGDEIALGDFDTTEAWRQGLGDWLARMVANEFDLGACHGWVLKYVSPGSNVFVHEIDYDHV